MRYMLLIYGSEAGRWANATPEEQVAELHKWDEYGKWLTEKGWMRSGDALHPRAQATTVRVRNGETLTTGWP